MDTCIVYLIIILVSVCMYWGFGYLRKQNIIKIDQAKTITQTLNIGERIISSINPQEAIIIVPILDIIELAIDAINDNAKQDLVVDTVIDNIINMAKLKDIQIDDSIKDVLMKIISEYLHK